MERLSIVDIEKQTCDSRGIISWRKYFYIKEIITAGAVLGHYDKQDIDGSATRAKALARSMM